LIKFSKIFKEKFFMSTSYWIYVYAASSLKSTSYF
jgi:hypothetical protein